MIEPGPTAGLAGALAEGFPVGDRFWPWGTTAGALAEALRAAGHTPARPHGVGDDHALEVEVDAVLGLPAVRASAWAAHVERPVTWSAHDLGGDDALLGPGGIDVIRAVLDPLLGLPEARRVIAGGGGASWRAGLVEVTAFTAPVLRELRGGATSAGHLRIEHPAAPLLAPYVAAARMARPGWATRPADDLAVHAVDGLRGRDRARADLAIGRDPSLHPTPAWAAAEGAAIAFSADGVVAWGDASVVRAVPVGSTVEHVRVRRARGPGWASLGHVHSEPGHDGLDELAAALARRGLVVHRVDAEDD